MHFGDFLCLPGVPPPRPPPQTPTAAPLRTPSLAGVTRPSSTSAVRRRPHQLLHVWLDVCVLLQGSFKHFPFHPQGGAAGPAGMHVFLYHMGPQNASAMLMGFCCGRNLLVSAGTGGRQSSLWSADLILPP